jgi:hypothetical protein
MCVGVFYKLATDDRYQICFAFSLFLFGLILCNIRLKPSLLDVITNVTKIFHVA